MAPSRAFMVMALVVTVIGLGLLLAAWVLPQLSDHLPDWVQMALVVSGLALIVSGALLGVDAWRH